MRRSAIKFGRHYKTDLDGSYLFVWHNHEFFLVLPEERRRLCIFAPATWKEYEPCGALLVPSVPIFGYKANAMVDVDDEGWVDAN